MIDRDKIKEALQALSDQHFGTITPEIVVSAAKSSKSPLHECFIWDDTEAARQYRVEQARTLLRSVRVSIVTDTCSYTVPYYIRNPSVAPDEQGYVSLPRLRSEPEMARDAIVQEFSRARAVLERAKDLAAVLGFDDKVEKVIGDVVGLRQMAVDYDHKAA